LKTDWAYSYTATGPTQGRNRILTLQGPMPYTYRRHDHGWWVYPWVGLGPKVSELQGVGLNTEMDMGWVNRWVGLCPAKKIDVFIFTRYWFVY